jgi:hypothetical protein
MMKIIATLLFAIGTFIFSRNLQAGDIHEAAKRGDLERIKSFDKSLLGSTDELGYTPLHWALIRARWETARYILDQGVNINIQGTEGGSPLHCAANHDNTEIIRLLVNKGANLEAKNAWGNTPLSLAAERGCKDAVAAFIALGADINTTSNESWTPLHYACQGEHKDVEKALIDAGASDTIKDQSGKIPSDYELNRPLPIAAEAGRFDEYVGDYNIGGGFLTVSLIEGKLAFEDFAVDEIYPIGRDIFYHSCEPWKIRFYRNMHGVVDRIAVEVQRGTLVGKKVRTRDEKIEKPLLGIGTRPLVREDISEAVLKNLFYDLKVNSNALIVTQIRDSSVAWKAGVQVNDIIVAFNNKTLNEPGDLLLQLYDIKPPAEVPVDIIRDGKLRHLRFIF